LKPQIKTEIYPILASPCRGAILARPLEMFFGLGRREIDERVEQALLDVRLEAGYAARYPDELSGGERQRVAIARALAAKPELLLCDEILSALDVSVQANILTLLQELRRDHSVAMLFISHDLAVVRHLADSVGVLFRGQLMQVGPARAIFSPPFHPYAHELLMAAPRPQAARRHATPRPAQAKPMAATGKGCLFAGRCAWQVGPLCDEVTPPWRTTDAGIRIRCHIDLGDLSRRAADGTPRSEARVNDLPPSRESLDR
jgi:peptide/nickel transport system ATP-binding protein